MDIVVKDPNFSVVVPGSCNAHCDFCFWKEKDTLSVTQFCKRLKTVSDLLPDQFYQVSVTGGEPTLCSGIEKILKILKKRFEKVIFTTNGIALSPEMVKDNVDHINISRHHWDDRINSEIFKTRGMPTAKELKILCDEINQIGIDVTFHCVLTDFINTKDDILSYIEFAKKIGASVVSFRKQHGPRSTNKPSNLEKLFSKYKEIYYSECPVCRSKTQIINGTPINWKSSMLEPSKGMDGIYELILNQDGILTSDWEAQQVVDLHNDEDDVIISIRRMGKVPESQKQRPFEQAIEQQISPLSEELTHIRRMQEESERQAAIEAEIRRPRRGTSNSSGSSCGTSYSYGTCG